MGPVYIEFTVGLQPLDPSLFTRPFPAGSPEKPPFEAPGGTVNMILREGAVKDRITAFVREAFGARSIMSVHIEIVDDSEPLENVINVDVVLRGQVDQEQISRFSVQLRKVLTEYKDNYFPVLSFISDGDFSN